MKLVAFDLETTGLDRENDQVLQIGAVVFTPDRSVWEEFSTYVYHERISGSPYALATNAAILQKLTSLNGPDIAPDPDNAWKRLGFFLSTHDAIGAYPVGFNVGSFDLGFAQQARYAYLFHHRAIELGTLMMPVLESDVPVSSDDAVKLLGVDRVVTHDALQDARDAAELYCLWWGSRS